MNKEEAAARIAELERQIKEKQTKEIVAPAAANGRDGYALCLSGGGGKGAYQVGVYRALSEYGLWKEVKAISGSSIGAINAALFATCTPEKADTAWREIDFDTVFTPDEGLMFNGKQGFMSRSEFQSLMDKYIDYNILRNGGMEVYATIAAYAASERYEARYVRLNSLSDNDIGTVITASSALPMIYESVSYEGREYYDGGLADNIPVKPLYDAGYRHLIVCGLSHDTRKDMTPYADADIIEIYPSVSLGELFGGTLNFSDSAYSFRSKLGYRDAMRALKVHFEKNPGYMAALDIYAASDLADIKAELAAERAEKRVRGSMDNIQDILEKYNGF